jgi:quinohemoprotein ethanol dehydrogenase
VQTGYGGAGVSNAIPPTSAAYARGNENRILVFKLGGGPTPMPPVLPEEPFPAPPPFQTTLAEINHGEEKFTEQCSRCHVFGHNITQDLSKLPPGVHDQFDDIVLHGVLAPVGMADFSDVITPADAHAIHAYLIALQRRGYAAQMRAQAKAAGR